MALLTLPIVDDARIDRSAATTNYGAVQVLYVDVVYVSSVKTQQNRSAIRLLLPAWLRSAQVNTAKLNLYANAITAGGTACWFDRITSGSDAAYWVESQVTWNSRKTGTAWTAAGGDFTGEGQVAWNTPAAAGAFSITGLAALVQDAIDSRNRLFDMMLTLQNEDPGSNVSCSMFSSEYAADPTLRPYLVIDYTPDEVNFGQVF